MYNILTVAAIVHLLKEEYVHLSKTSPEGIYLFI